MYAVMIKGFSTKEEAESFIKWYGEQGEQDAAIWFDEQNKENGGKFPCACSGKAAKKIEKTPVTEVLTTYIEMI